MAVRTKSTTRWLLLLAIVLMVASCTPASQGGQQAPAAETPVQAAPEATQGAPEASQGGAQTSAATEAPAQAAPEPAQEAQQPVAGGAVTRALTTEPPSLDPQGRPGSGQNAILPYLFDTLVYRDHDNTYKPFLAEEWEFSEDGKEVTFRLREGVRFHDGTPMDAEAVAFTFRRFQEKGAANPLATGVQDIASVEAVDEYTVRFVLKAPSPTFLGTLSLPYAGIISPAAVETYGEDFGLHPVGTGPFRLKAWEAGTSIVLERNPDYAWGPPVVENRGAPYLDEVRFLFIPDAATQLAALEAGEVDILFVNNPAHVEKLRANPDVNLNEVTLNSLIYLGFHCAKPPFDDVRVRQALAHAVDKEEILKVALGGVGQVAFAPLAPTLPGFDPSLKAYELGYDPERSKSLLEEAGFVLGDDGVWERDGQALQAVLLTSTRAPNGDIATVLQDQFARVGVQV
ncbi:MAG: hypothetical protein H5T59_01810, partial [Anaerolineae bacterium]|nr:hypothetical protein [Anaerolineae bacterium]